MQSGAEASSESGGLEKYPPLFGEGGPSPISQVTMASAGGRTDDGSPMHNRTKPQRSTPIKIFSESF